MVCLTLQPVFTHLSDVTSATSSDDLQSIWAVISKAKTSISQGYRLENLSWRLWHASARGFQKPSTPSDSSHDLPPSSENLISTQISTFSNGRALSPKENETEPSVASSSIPSTTTSSSSPSSSSSSRHQSPNVTSTSPASYDRLDTTPVRNQMILTSLTQVLQEIRDSIAQKKSAQKSRSGNRRNSSAHLSVVTPYPLQTRRKSSHPTTKVELSFSKEDMNHRQRYSEIGPLDQDKLSSSKYHQLRSRRGETFAPLTTYPYDEAHFEAAYRAFGSGALPVTEHPKAHIYAASNMAPFGQETVTNTTHDIDQSFFARSTSSEISLDTKQSLNSTTLSNETSIHRTSPQRSLLSLLFHPALKTDSEDDARSSTTSDSDHESPSSSESSNSKRTISQQHKFVEHQMYRRSKDALSCPNLSSLSPPPPPNQPAMNVSNMRLQPTRTSFLLSPTSHPLHRHHHSSLKNRLHVQEPSQPSQPTQLSRCRIHSTELGSELDPSLHSLKTVSPSSPSSSTSSELALPHLHQSRSSDGDHAYKQSTNSRLNAYYSEMKQQTYVIW